MSRNYYIYIILLAFLMSGCRTKRDVIREVREYHDTVRIEGVRSDSVWVHDSVTIMVQGDTVRETRWRVEYRDRWRDVARDVIREVHDTTVVTKTIEVRKPPSFIDRAKTWLILIFLFIAIIFVYRFRKGVSR